ncbi:unnamed protein product [Closterium sp. Naga37s-1]|nr:unnamed protein product [Closterium sp. Naga37s-1]
MHAVIPSGFATYIMWFEEVGIGLTIRAGGGGGRDAPKPVLPVATDHEEDEVNAEADLAGEADEVDTADKERAEAVSRSNKEEDGADEAVGSADGWSDDGDEWWALGRYERE